MRPGGDPRPQIFDPPDGHKCTPITYSKRQNTFMTTGETHKLQGQSSSTQPTLVLLHGSGDSAQTWGRLLPLLGGLSCLALDLPGHGERAERPGPSVMSVADYAASVRGMLARRGLEHVCLVGHSLGGAIA